MVSGDCLINIDKVVGLICTTWNSNIGINL